GNVDYPDIATGPGYEGDNGSVWVSWHNKTEPDAEGHTQSQVFVSGAEESATSAIGSFTAPEAVTPLGGFALATIAIGPDGEVAVSSQDDTSIYVSVDPDGFGGDPFNARVTVATDTIGEKLLI